MSKLDWRRAKKTELIVEEYSFEQQQSIVSRSSFYKRLVDTDKISRGSTSRAKPLSWRKIIFSKLQECTIKREFDENGYDKSGYDKNGYDSSGYDRYGYDKNGRDRRGYNKNGYDKEGFDRFGFDYDGFDRDGFNRGGLDIDGYNKSGFNRRGLQRSKR